MDTTRIESRIGVRASVDRLWDLIGNFDAWSQWNPYETEVEGSLSIGGSISLNENLPGFGSRQVSGRLGDWQPLTKLMWSERRGFLFQSTRYFTLQELDRKSSILTHGAILTGLRGENFYDKHRHQVRAAYDSLSENLKRIAEIED